MPILNVQPNQVGQSGVFPAIIYILTNDTLAEVSATGYLNGIVSKFGIPLSESDIALVTTKTSPNSNSTQVGWFAVTKSGENWSLTAPTSEGGVILPTTANHIATYTNTLGELSEDATTAINNGNIQATQSLIGGTGVTATTGDINAVTGNLNSLTGNVSAGSSGHAGSLISFPATAVNGVFALSAVNAGGGFNTIVSNSVMGQSSVISIPNPGATTANFLLDTGASNILAMQQFVGLSNVLSFGTGTWTITRIAEGNYVARHTPTDETSIIGIDITPIIRTVAAKGFRLDSFDVIYAITTLAMDAHTVTLDRIAYANNVAVSVTSIAITGTLSTATQANPYLTNVTVNAPAFDVTADSKYVIEVTANNSATSAYDFYGIMLKFSQTVA